MNLSRLVIVALILALPSSLRADTLVPNGDPEVREDGVVRFCAQGEFRSTPQAARESALHAAQEQMKSWLAKQDPPIRKVPTLDVIGRDMVRQQEPAEEVAVGKDKMHKITLVVELRPSHVRDLRERDRAFAGLWTLGGVLAIISVVALFFRFDEWTKGYLTRWLIAGGVGITAAVAGVWWFAR